MNSLEHQRQPCCHSLEWCWSSMRSSPVMFLLDLGQEIIGLVWVFMFLCFYSIVYIFFLSLFLFHKLDAYWYIDYSYWISCFGLILWNQVQVMFYTIFSTHAFMVCFQYLRNLQVNSFMMLLPIIATCR